MGLACLVGTVGVMGLVGLVGLFGLLGLLGRVPKSTNIRHGVCKSDCSGGSGGPSGSCES